MGYSVNGQPGPSFLRNAAPLASRAEQARRAQSIIDQARARTASTPAPPPKVELSAGGVNGEETDFRDDVLATADSLVQNAWRFFGRSANKAGLTWRVLFNMHDASATWEEQGKPEYTRLVKLLHPDKNPTASRACPVQKSALGLLLKLSRSTGLPKKEASASREYDERDSPIHCRKRPRTRTPDVHLISVRTFSSKF